MCSRQPDFIGDPGESSRAMRIAPERDTKEVTKNRKIQVMVFGGSV